MTRRGDLHYYLGTTAPPVVPTDQSVAVTGAVTGATAGAPLIGIEGFVPPRLRATLHRRPHIGPVVAELSGAMNRRWQDEMNSPGSASMDIPNEDPQSTLVQPGDIIRFEDDGYACFAWIVQTIERVQIARGEEIDQVTRFSGKGILDIMREAVVYPANSLDALPRGPEGMSMRPIEIDRYFSWQSNAYDDTAWLNAKLLVRYWPGQNETPPGEPEGSGMFAGVTNWPAPGTWRITTNQGDYWVAPGGWCYFRKLFWIDDLDPTRNMIIYGLADDESKWWFDGLPMYETFQWENSTNDLIEFHVDVAPGWHYLAVAIHNSELGAMWSENFGRAINPMSIMCVGYQYDINTGEVLGSPIVQTDESWKIVDYPPGPPGWTPGEVIARIMFEAVWSRGTLLDVGYGFTEEADSDGNPWPMVTDIATKVGTDYLTFLTELAETYIDFWMEPGTFRLQAWIKGQRGGTPDVELHAVSDPNDPMSGNLAGLTYTRVD